MIIDVVSSITILVGFIGALWVAYLIGRAHEHERRREMRTISLRDIF